MYVRQIATCVILLIILAPGLVGIAHAQSCQTNSEDNAGSDVNQNLVRDAGTAQIVSATIIGLASFGSVLSISIVKERSVVLKIISPYSMIIGCISMILIAHAAVIIQASNQELTKLGYATTISVTVAFTIIILFCYAYMMAVEVGGNGRNVKYKRMCRDAMSTYKP